MENYLMDPNMRTLVLAMSLALISGGAIAESAIVTDVNSGHKIATTFDMNADVSVFGKSDVAPTMNTEEQAITELAHFFGDDTKTVLVRYYTEYAALKDLAIKHGVTTPARLAGTTVISLNDKAAMLGIVDIDTYAIKNGLVTADEYMAGGLYYETKVLTAVNSSIDARLATGELKQIKRPIAGIVPFNRELS